MVMDYLALSHASKQCAALLACDLTARRAEFAASRVWTALLVCLQAAGSVSSALIVCTTRQSIYYPAEVPQGCVRLDPSVTKAH